MLYVKRDQLNEFIIYVLMLLIGMNFLGNAVVLTFVFGLFCLFFIRQKLVFPRNIFIVIVMILGILGSLVINDNLSVKTLLKLLVYPIMYLTLYEITCSVYDKSGNGTQPVIVFANIVFAFMLGNMVHLLGDMAITDLSTVNTGHRVLNDIWTGGTTPSTIIVGWGCLDVSCMLFFFEKKRHNKMKFLLSLALSVAYVVFSVIIATRLGIVNAIFLIFLFIFLLAYYKDINVNVKTLIKIFIGLCVLVFIGYKLFPYIKTSNLYLRMTKDNVSLLDTNGRSDATIYLLNHFFEALWGGEYFTNSYGLQQHNILFQMYDLYGIVPFFSFIGILIKSVMNMLQISLSPVCENYCSRFILLFYISLMLYCFEEPALTSNYIMTGMIFGFLGFSSAMKISSKRGEHRH